MISPPSIASAEAFGVASLNRTISLTGRGIASAQAFGAPVVIRPANLYTMYIAGVDVTRYVKTGSIRRSWSISGGSRCQLSFGLQDRAGAYRPLIDDTVMVYEGAGRFFNGRVESYTEEFHNGTTCSEINVTCTDLGTICDRRLVYKRYTPFLGSFFEILAFDVANRFLDGTGIHFELGGPAGAQFGELIFNYCTATEGLNQAAEAAGVEWMVDLYGNLRHFAKGTGRVAAPWTITDSDGNFDSITVQRSRSSRRNRQAVRSASSAVATWTDTVHPAAGDYIIPTTYPQDVTPIVLVNGVEKVIVEQSDGGVRDFVYLAEGMGIWSETTPFNGTETVQVIYPSWLSRVVWAEDATDIAAHGKIEAIEEVADMPDDASMLAVAQGLIDRYKIDVEAVTIVSRKAGWEPGQLVTVNSSTPPITGTLLIEQVDSDEGEDNSFFRNTLRCTNAPARADKFDTTLGRIIELTRNPLDRITQNIRFTLAETIEGVTNPGLTVGLKQCHAIVEKDGVLRDVRLRFRSVDLGTPTTALVKLDVYRNGVSVFNAAKLQFPVAHIGSVLLFWFASDPYKVYRGDVFTIEVLNADPLAKDGVLELVILG